ncbi:MAG: hypothetical protein IJA34_07790 [Lachnospiraceae bacterium]|nr:hypothetical protein [Lachnospiraceae bacterium]
MDSNNEYKQMEEIMSADCNSCSFYVYDEEYEEYFCQVNMDEDDYFRLISNDRFECPYYQLYDEYKIVRKQM